MRGIGSQQKRLSKEIQFNRKMHTPELGREDGMNRRMLRNS